MTIKRTTIRSCPDADCPFPWVEIEDFKVTRDGVELRIAKVTGPAARPDVAADHAKERKLEKAHKFPFVGEDGKREQHTLALTMEGELIFVPLSKQPPILYAHLAFVNADTLDAEVLAFEDMDEHIEEEAPTDGI